jgi:hypothetical protein
MKNHLENVKSGQIEKESFLLMYIFISIHLDISTWFFVCFFSILLLLVVLFQFYIFYCCWTFFLFIYFLSFARAVSRVDRAYRQSWQENFKSFQKAWNLRVHGMEKLCSTGTVTWHGSDQRALFYTSICSMDFYFL